ncbi:MAG: hypothetical protein ABIG94_05530 [Pseudomonadota bacterium]
MKNLSRFNYWDFPAINPLLAAPGGGPVASPVVAPPSLGDYFRSRCTAGDEDAVFEFAAQDKTALRRRWVVVVLEAWQRQGTEESRAKVHHFIRQFLQPAAGEPISLLNLIGAEQEAFKDMVNLHHSLRLPLGEATRLVAQRKAWPQALASEVYQHYMNAVDAFFTSDDDGNHPWPEVFAWLEKCLENLKRL